MTMKDLPIIKCSSTASMYVFCLSTRFKLQTTTGAHIQSQVNEGLFVYYIHPHQHINSNTIINKENNFFPFIQFLFPSGTLPSPTTRPHQHPTIVLKIQKRKTKKNETSQGQNYYHSVPSTCPGI